MHEEFFLQMLFGRPNMTDGIGSVMVEKKKTTAANKLINSGEKSDSIVS
jgi:hypothetical protein